MRQANATFSALLTKLGNGEILNNLELSTLESRFCSYQEANDLYPNAIRLYFSNTAVDKYNNFVLQSMENVVVSKATDVVSGSKNATEEAIYRQLLHKTKPIDTGGLPYEISFGLGKHYLITTNISVVDGLANGAVGELVHIEYQNRELIRIWLKFPLQKIGEQIRKKAAVHISRHNYDPLAVPIGRRTSTVSLNKNKTVVARRNHFPLKQASALTIHKSQGGTFETIVYDYERVHPNQMVYVALSRVTSIDGLHITSPKDNKRFYHGRQSSSSMNSLKNEFQRLSFNHLQTIEMEIVNFITMGQGISIFSFNCQDLHSHLADLIDSITSRCHFLLLSEININNESNVPLQNFHCVAQYKRSTKRSAEVAIYCNMKNPIINFIPINVNTTLTNTSNCSVGDLC